VTAEILGYELARDRATLRITGTYGTETVDVYQGSSFLQGQCRLTRLIVDNRTGLTGSVDITCTGAKAFTLKLLAQAGTFEIFADPRDPDQLLIPDNQGEIDFGTRTGENAYQSGRFRLNTQETLERYDVTGGGSWVKVGPSKDRTQQAWYNAVADGLARYAQAGTLTSEGGMNVLRERTYAPDIEANISATIAAYRLVAEQYPAERGADVEGIEPYGEQALYRAVQVAGTYGKQMTQAALLGELLLHYPDSLRKEQYQAELDRLHAVDGSESTGVLSLQNQYRTITLVGVSKPLSKAHALLKINNEDVRLEEGKNWTRENSFIKLTRIKPEEVTLITNCAYSYRRASGSVDEPQAARTGGSYTLHLNEFDDATICGKGVRISNIESENVVRVRLSTTAERTESQTNLTVRIGIEKRAIQLSPAKAAERVSNLNKSIQRWEQLNKNLEKIVTGMKGACFATAGVLMVKNFFNGLAGKGFARKEAMNGANGWTDFCRTQVSNGKFATLDSCYTANNAAIEQDVAKRDEAVKQVNKKITEIQKHPNITRSDGLLSDSVDTEQAAAQYRTYLNQTYSSDLIAQGIDVKHASYTELRETHMNLLLQKQGGGSALLQEDVKGKLKGIGKSTVDQRTLSLQLKADAEATAQGDIQGIVVAPNYQLPRQGAIMSKQAAVSTKNPYYGGTYAHYTKVTTTASVDQNGNPLFAPATYGLGLEKQTDGSYVTKDVFDSTGRLLTEQERAQFINTYNVGSFRDSASSNWEKNKWEKPTIQYYESEPHKGLPALVPVDPDHGWYVATKPTLPAFGGLAGWESSGRVASFYLCNVGENKRPDVFTGYSDDSCTLINLGAGQAADKVPGVPEGRAAQLVKQAREALEDAARAHKQGLKEITLQGSQHKKAYKVGMPAVPLPGVQCQDYMSPSECNLLFNVCDPVICPASRCNFGGKYPVQDVVQSGIIGSTLLCLPNFPDVKIPVCLTGIHAGIDAYTSILKAHRDCLQESITSGRMVGICDQIYSIYSCEFFWRQLSPLANIFIPKLLEKSQGQGARGGGEYLTVQNAWQSTKQSTDYFTQVYGVNAFRAFQIRSTEEVGGEICKGFASGQFPGSFKSLVKPDSPVQFHASFSSIKYTDATVPATAQYKVFYHIYAGKDQGAGYRIYLRNPPATSYYASQPTIQVASGFVGKGQYADETKDFTAPEGYQELCVSINGDERCGFKQVSTSFAVNQLRDQVVADELKNTQITTETQCISGTVSASALLNPNLQQMADEATNPGIYRRGIIRICATGNPGQTTDPTRFVEVGECGDKRLKCWLDKQSVQNAITDVNKGVKNATYEWFANRTVANLEKDGTILGAESGYAELTRLEGVVNSIETYQGQKSRLSSDHLSRISLLAREFMQTKDALFFNHHRARLGWLEGRVQEVLLKHLVASKADSLQQAGQLDKGILVRERGNTWEIKILASGIWISVADFKEDPNYFDQLSSFQQSTLNYLLEQTAETSESDTLGKHHYLLDQPGVTVTSNKNTEQAYYYVPRGDEETTSATPPAGKSPALPKTPPSFDRRVGQTFTLASHNEGYVPDVHWRYSYGLQSWQWSYDKAQWNGLTRERATYGLDDDLLLFAQADEIRLALLKDNDEELGNVLLLNAGAKITAAPSLLPPNPAAEREAKKADLVKKQADARAEGNDISTSDFLLESSDAFTETAYYETLQSFCLLRSSLAPGFVAGTASATPLASRFVPSSGTNALVDELASATPLASRGGSAPGTVVRLLAPAGFASIPAVFAEGSLLLHEGRLFFVKGTEVLYEILAINKGVPDLIKGFTLPSTLKGFTITTQRLPILDITFESLPKLVNAAGAEIPIADNFVVATAQGLKTLPANSKTAMLFSRLKEFISHPGTKSAGKWTLKIINFYSFICAPVTVLTVADEMNKMFEAQHQASLAGIQADDLNWIIKSSRERIEALVLASKDLVGVYRHNGFDEDPAVAQMLNDLERFTEGARTDTLALATRYTAFELNEDTADYSRITTEERARLISDWKKINTQLRDLKEALGTYTYTLVKQLPEADELPTFSVPSYISITRKPDFILNKALVFDVTSINNEKFLEQDRILSIFASTKGGANTHQTLFVLHPEYTSRYLGSGAGVGARGTTEYTLQGYTARIKGTYTQPRPLWFAKKIVIDEQVGTITRANDGTITLTIDSQKARSAAIQLLQTADEVRAFVQQVRLLERAEIKGTEIYSLTSQQSPTKKPAVPSVKDDTSPTAGSGTPLKD
jgi:hypothetical protein